MPELPEVETVARQLQARLPGHGIATVRVLRADALGDVPPADFAAALEGRRFGAITRRGKYLLMALEPDLHLVAHLRMTGKFVLVDDPTETGKHDRVRFELTPPQTSNGGVNTGRQGKGPQDSRKDSPAALVFQDMRCFGTLRLCADPEALPGVAALGVEPLSRDFSPTWLVAALGATDRPLKHFLMDQGRIAGLGNIYASEILFRAGLSPFLPARQVTPTGARALHGATRAILKAAIASNGTTISDFRPVDSKTGEFQNFLKVYGKTGQPCPKCRAPIQRAVQQQRSTFWCAHCQEGPAHG